MHEMEQTAFIFTYIDVFKLAKSNQLYGLWIINIHYNVLQDYLNNYYSTFFYVYRFFYDTAFLQYIWGNNY